MLKMVFGFWWGLVFSFLGGLFCGFFFCSPPLPSAASYLSSASSITLLMMVTFVLKLMGLFLKN